MSKITLAHGNGGRLTRKLIEEIFARYLGNPNLDIQCDAASLPNLLGEGWLITTDGFTVQPLEFPGGDIGSLAIHGTVNDLAVSGAKPYYLTLNAFIEEGIELALLERLVQSMAKAAHESHIQIVAGDTKVVGRGEGGGIYFATTGLGRRLAYSPLGMNQIRVGDSILVSGTVGDHGAAVMLARGSFGLHGQLGSDSAALFPLVKELLTLPGIHFMRDPTRGGLTTVIHEIAQATGFSIRLSAKAIPIRDTVRTVCDILGYDPYYLASEGRVVVVMAKEIADQAQTLLHHLGYTEASIIGTVAPSHGQRTEVILETELGGERLLDELEEDPLPRIC